MTESSSLAKRDQVFEGHQRCVLNYLREYIEREGVAPSTREIAAHCGINSKATITRVLDALAQQGHIRRRRRTPRGIALKERKDER